MSQASAPIQGMDFHLLQSALLNFGVSPGGAYQFMQGLPLANQADRDVLRGRFREQLVNESAAQSTLLNFGVTLAGAYQFMQGLPVVSQEDRDALHAMFLGLTKGLTMLCRKAGGDKSEWKLGLKDVNLSHY
jgi:hypothetical protein